jgi:hypothetical protein
MPAASQAVVEALHDKGMPMCTVLAFRMSLSSTT